MRDMGVHCFPFIGLKVNMISQLKFEHIHFKAALQQISYQATENPPTYLGVYLSIHMCVYVHIYIYHIYIYDEKFGNI